MSAWLVKAHACAVLPTIWRRQPGGMAHARATVCQLPVYSSWEAGLGSYRDSGRAPSDSDRRATKRTGANFKRS